MKIKHKHAEIMCVHHRLLDDDDFKYILETMAMLYRDSFGGDYVDGSFKIEFYDEHEDCVIHNKIAIRFTAFVRSSQQTLIHQ